MKYTLEETKELICGYKACETETERADYIDNTSLTSGKSVASVRAKLVAEGVYISKKRRSKITGGTPKSKEFMVDEMEKEFDFPIGSLEGLEKAPKLVLVTIYKRLKKLS